MKPARIPSPLLVAFVALLALALLAGCVAIMGPCDLLRDSPTSWSLSCAHAGTAIVLPPSTLTDLRAPQPASGVHP